MRRLRTALLPYRRWLARLAGTTPLISSDIAGWIEEGGSGKILGWIGEPTTTWRTLPQCAGELGQVPPDIFPLNQEPEVYPRPVAQLPDAVLCGIEGFLRLPDGSYTLQTAWYPQQITLHPDYYQRRQKPVVEMRGTYFSLVLYWSKQYYHWLTENLPLLHGVMPFLPEGTRFIIPGPPSKFHVESMELLGISRDRWVFYDGSEAWKVESLIFAPPATTSFAHLAEAELYAGRRRLHHPTHFNGPFNHAPEAIQWLGKSLVAAAQASPVAERPTATRIYISREKANCRRIANAVEFEALLTEHGFKTCYLETLSLAEQVRLFQGADVVVGPHGAGLSNLMFCRPGTQVVEIFEPAVVRLCYWSISSIMQLPYTCYFGKSQPGTVGLDANIRIDLAGFDDCLRRVMR